MKENNPDEKVGIKNINPLYVVVPFVISMMTCLFCWPKAVFGGVAVIGLAFIVLVLSTFTIGGLLHLWCAIFSVEPEDLPKSCIFFTNLFSYDDGCD